MKNKIIYICILIFFSAVSFSLGWRLHNGGIPMLTTTERPATIVFDMAQTDKDRIVEIVTGVVEDTVPATEGTKQELKALFVKYNMSNTSIELFKLAGPGFVSTNYDVLFFMDAMESLKTGIPFKSEARAYAESVALTFKTMAKDTIEMYNQEIEKIAKKEPALNPPEILTENDIMGLLNYSRIRLTRLGTLFDENNDI